MAELSVRAIVWGFGERDESAKQNKKHLKPAKCEKWIINSNNVSSRVCIVNVNMMLMVKADSSMQCVDLSVPASRLSVPSLI